VMNTTAMMLKKFEYSWITLADETMKEKCIVSYMGAIGSDGYISGEGMIVSSGYAKNPKTKALENGNEKYVEAKFKQGSDLEINDFSAKNAADDTLDLIEQFKFRKKTSNSGDYLYFNTNMFTGLEQNPFIAEKRNTDIEFGFTRRFVMNARILFPENFLPEELPENLRMIMPDTSIHFSRFYEKRGNAILLRMELDFNRAAFRAWEYPSFKVFYKKLFDMLNEQIVFKRKKPSIP
jgi:hypothetical protein